MALTSNSVHVVYIAPMTVSTINGAVINKTSASTTINDMLNTYTMQRIIADATVPSSASNPDIPTYLKSEAAAGYVLKHMDNSVIVTYLNSDLLL